jgi:hypothetical protein
MLELLKEKIALVTHGTTIYPAYQQKTDIQSWGITMPAMRGSLSI